MARKYIDCRELPSQIPCTLRISGDDENDLLDAAVQHALSKHGHPASPDLRDQIRSALKSE